MKVKFDGLVPPQFKGFGEKAEDSTHMDNLPAQSNCIDLLSDIYNARIAQKQYSALSESFSRFGFALSSHKIPFRPWDSTQTTARKRDSTSSYIAELKSLVQRDLIPNVSLEIFRADPLLIRGPESQYPYATGVHQDVGITREDYVQNLRSIYSAKIADDWCRRYSEPDVAGYIVINFWRTVDMLGPLDHMPLALCDPHSVHPSDLVPYSLPNPVVGGMAIDQTALRYNPRQAWYFFPKMESHELLSFKLFECFKGVPDEKLSTCFHAAFSDPSAPLDAEPRKSCEQRIGFFCLRDKA